MNVLFLLNNIGKWFTEDTLDLANHFASQGDHVCFAIEHNIVEKNFEQEIPFPKYYFSEYDEINPSCLEAFENVNLSKIIYPCFNRIVMMEHKDRYAKIKDADSIIKRLLSFFFYVFEKENIDVVIYENISNSYAYAAFFTALHFGKAFAGNSCSRIPGRAEICFDPYGEIERRDQYFQSLQISDLSTDELQSYTEYIRNINKLKPDYMKNNPTSMNVNYTKFFLDRIGGVFKAIKYSQKWDEKSYQNPSPFHLVKYTTKRILARKKRLKKLRRMFDAIPENGNYFIYPMHYQPESSTSVNAMFYDNQVEVIKNIAFSLPLGYKLLVKDHPNGIGFLPMEDYEAIKKIPGVLYVSPLEDNKRLINNSRGIITLTSTMGYEALLMDKPVVTVGKVFYNFHPFCFHAEGYNEIFDCIQQALHCDTSKFQEYNLLFTKTNYDFSYERGTDFPKSFRDALIERIATREGTERYD